MNDNKYCVLQLLGGLGNQLFQLATLFAYCKQTGRIPTLPKNKSVNEPNDRPLYWKSLFLSALNKYVVDTLPDTSYIIQEKSNMYNQLEIEGIDEHVIVELKGYFQSPKYFKHYLNEFLNTINYHDFRDSVFIKYSNIFNACRGRIISMHFRVGDYVKQQCYHPVLVVDYYISALKELLNERPLVEEWTILLFSEQSANLHVAKYVAEIIEKINSDKTIHFQRFPNATPEEELVAMTMCNDHIIANSTFSWWGAYLNQKNDKTVLYPGSWYGHQLFYLSISDMLPEDWIKIKCPGIYHACPILNYDYALLYH